MGISCTTRERPYESNGEPLRDTFSKERYCGCGADESYSTAISPALSNSLASHSGVETQKGRRKRRKTDKRLGQVTKGDGKAGIRRVSRRATLPPTPGSSQRGKGRVHPSKSPRPIVHSVSNSSSLSEVAAQTQQSATLALLSRAPSEPLSGVSRNGRSSDRSSSSTSSSSSSTSSTSSSTSSTSSSTIVSIRRGRSGSVDSFISPPRRERRLSDCPLPCPSQAGRLKRPISAVETPTQSQKTLRNKIPDRYIQVCNGDLQAASERWQATLNFRELHDLDHILSKPHPNFNWIKLNYPHFYHKKSKEGYTICFERPGGVNLKALQDAKITLSDLLWHYYFITEFQWNYVNPNEYAKVMTVIDLKGLVMTDIAKNKQALEYLKQTNEFQRRDHPNRSFKIIIVNAPYWFNFLWSTLISPAIDSNTRLKTQVYSSNGVEALLEHIKREDLPAEFGGKCRCQGKSCREWSPEEVMLRKLVEKNNVSST